MWNWHRYAIRNVLMALTALAGFGVVSAAAIPADAAFDPVPADEEFVPLLCDGEPAWDPLLDDQPDHRDIVGDEERPAVLRTATEDHLYLRLRLDGDPRQNPDQLKAFGWGYLFDVPPSNFDDGDPATNTYDYLLHLRGGGGHDGMLALHSNEGQTELDDPSAPASGDIHWDHEHNAPDPIWHVKEAEGEPFGNEPADYLLTVAVPWDDLTPYDIHPESATVLWVGTTTSNQAIDRDFACHDGTGNDPLMSDFSGDPAPLDPNVDQCASGSHSCDEDATCIDLGDGDYDCECDDGFVGDGFSCEPDDDVDHCAEGTHSCNVDATCTDLGDGDYDCECSEGFSGDGFDCEPDDGVDHCEEDFHSCDDNAECIDDPEDGYQCECDDGFVGDGFDCEFLDDGVIITTKDEQVTNDDTPTVEGKAEPGSEVEIVVDGEVVDTVTADEDGNWSWTADESMEDGDYTIVARPEGGDPEDGDSITITIDTEPPHLDVTSPEPGDLLDGDTIVVSGTAEPGSTVEVVVDGEVVGTTTADEDGNWEMEIDVDGDGDHDLEVTATDEAGNTTSDDIDITIDDAFSVTGAGVACAAANGPPVGGLLVFAVALFGLAIRRRNRDGQRPLR